MSGLEVVGVIAGIISAYTGAHVVFQNWRKARESRRHNKQNLKLDNSLVVGSSTIQQTYDEHFARLGQRFAVGDSIARSELQVYIIKLQAMMMSLMAGGNAMVMPDFPLHLSTSENSRKGVVNTLAQQYQRMSQATPIRPSPFPKLLEYSPSEPCKGRRKQTWTRAISCSKCHYNKKRFNPLGSYYGAAKQWVKGGFSFVAYEIRVWNWHLKVSEGSEDKELSYGCQICNDGQVYGGFKSLVDHLRDDHTREQLERQGAVMVRKDTDFVDDLGSLLNKF